MQLELDFNKGKHCVVSLSGGMDSSTLLLRALKDYDTCTAISFDYGQKHRIELERAQSLVNYLETKGYKINYRQIHLDGLVDLLDSTLTSGGEDVPEGHYAEENMKATVVPNRNKIFSSIVQAVALSVVGKTGEKCDIALGIHSGDHAVYPDTTEEFRQADLNAFKIGNWDSDKVEFFAPYMEGDKFTILQDGEVLCKELGLDFDEVYKRTNTSYKPIQHFIMKEVSVGPNHKELQPIPIWYSDYKSASSVERVEAFIKLGRPDPVSYANNEGPVDWDTVVNHVKQVLAEYND